MPKRRLQGIVFSSKSDKTIIVKVSRTIKHPIYKKIVKKDKKYAAHDPHNLYKEGDKVIIIESRPYSKTKTFIVEEDNI